MLCPTVSPDAHSQYSSNDGMRSGAYLPAKRAAALTCRSSSNVCSQMRPELHADGARIDVQLVVDDDEAAVARLMHVHLDRVAANLDRLAEREHRVFRISTAVAAVCHNFHAIVSLNK